MPEWWNGRHNGLRNRGWKAWEFESLFGYNVLASNPSREVHLNKTRNGESVDLRNGKYLRRDTCTFSSVGRALPLHGRCHRFESYRVYKGWSGNDHINSSRVNTDWCDRSLQVFTQVMPIVKEDVHWTIFLFPNLPVSHSGNCSWL